jgi:hypothetical protein
MKAYREAEVWLHTFFDSTAHGGASSPGYYTSGREPWYSLTSPTTNQNTVKNKKISCSCMDSKPRLSSLQSSVYTDYVIPALNDKQRVNSIKLT